MKKCPHCKATFDDDKAFCLNDGAALQKMETGENFGLPDDADAPQTIRAELPPQFQTQTPFPQTQNLGTQNQTTHLSAPPTAGFAAAPQANSHQNSNFNLLLILGIGAFVAVAVLFGLGVLGVAFYAFSRSPETIEKRRTPPVDKENLAATAHYPHLMTAIKNADLQEIEAYRTVSAEPLEGIYQGELLELKRADLDYYRKNNLYSDNKLEKQIYESFSVSTDERRAEVRLTETWSTITYRKTKNDAQCVSVTPSHDVDQTIYLKRDESDVWRIESILIHDTMPKITPESCGGES